MSEPLISPWLIYLVSVCDNISNSDTNSIIKCNHT